MTKVGILHLLPLGIPSSDALCDGVCRSCARCCCVDDQCLWRVGKDAFYNSRRRTFCKRMQSTRSAIHQHLPPNCQLVILLSTAIIVLSLLFFRILAKSQPGWYHGSSSWNSSRLRYTFIVHHRPTFGQRTTQGHCWNGRCCSRSVHFCSDAVTLQFRKKILTRSLVVLWLVTSKAAWRLHQSLPDLWLADLIRTQPLQ